MKNIENSDHIKVILSAKIIYPRNSSLELKLSPATRFSYRANEKHIESETTKKFLSHAHNQSNSYSRNMIWSAFQWTNIRT